MEEQRKSENALVPALRFEGFSDPWEQRKLGEVAHRVTRKNEEGASDLPLTISAQQGLVDQRDFFNSQVASRDMRGYYLLERGEFAYNKSTSGESPWGAVKRLMKYEKGCLSTLYICFGLDESDPNYLVTYYETNRWHKGIQMIAAEGARNHGLLNIAPSDFFETRLTLPRETEEQTAIGALFQKLDSLIALHQRKHEKLKTVKQSLLEKMFPKEGEDVPEIRFEGFTDPWEQRRLGEICDEVTRRNPLSEAPVMMITAESGFIEQSERYSTDNAGESLQKYIVLRRGELAYNHGASKLRPFGSCFNLLADEARIPFVYHCFSLRSDCPAFTSLELNGGQVEDQLRTLVSSGARMDGLLNISFEEYQTVRLLLPSLDEQRQIAGLFAKLDSLIALHQRELDILKNLKQALLEKMFV